MGISLKLLTPIGHTAADEMHWLTPRKLFEVNLINTD
jgi:hypothetical protein